MTYIVRSNDGTEISCRITGQGSPVLLVHGLAADGTHWDPIASLLSFRFKVYAMDRRGRGASGDTAPYAIEREYEDIAAVVESIGIPVALVGHSFGGLCALEAALRTGLVRKLALYEPATRPAELDGLYPGDTIEQLEALVTERRRAEAVAGLFRDLLQVSPEELALMQSQVMWERRLAAAHTIPRELRAHRDYGLDPARFRDLNVPVLLIMGSMSSAAPRIQTEAAAAALPFSHTIELPGQSYEAIDSAPGLLARELVEWLRDTF